MTILGMTEMPTFTDTLLSRITAWIQVDQGAATYMCKRSTVTIVYKELIILPNKEQGNEYYLIYNATHLEGRVTVLVEQTLRNLKQ